MLVTNQKTTFIYIKEYEVNDSSGSCRYLSCCEGQYSEGFQPSMMWAWQFELVPLHFNSFLISLSIVSRKIKWKNLEASSRDKSMLVTLSCNQLPIITRPCLVMVINLLWASLEKALDITAACQNLTVTSDVCSIHS